MLASAVTSYKINESYADTVDITSKKKVSKYETSTGTYTTHKVHIKGYKKNKQGKRVPIDETYENVSVNGIPE